jgi:hypothetical protein
MPKKRKLTLEDLKVRSFVTNLNEVKSKKGGIDPEPTEESYCYSCYQLCSQLFTACIACTDGCQNLTDACQYPTKAGNDTCDTSPGCGLSEFSCGGATCSPSCFSCAGGPC